MLGGYLRRASCDVALRWPCDTCLAVTSQWKEGGQLCDRPVDKSLMGFVYTESVCVCVDVVTQCKRYTTVDLDVAMSPVQVVNLVCTNSPQFAQCKTTVLTCTGRIER